MSDRVLVMENGEIISDDTPQNTGINLKQKNIKTFLSLPSPMRIWDSCDGKSPCPVTVTQGRKWLEEYAENHTLFKLPNESIPCNDGNVCIELKDVWFRYEKDSPDVLKGLSLNVFKGEFVTVLGGNGTGKSTLLSVLCGISSPYSGSVKIADAHIDGDINIACLPQNPQTLFVKKTVLEDLLEVFDGRRT